MTFISSRNLSWVTSGTPLYAFELEKLLLHVKEISLIAVNIRLSIDDEVFCVDITDISVETPVKYRTLFVLEVELMTCVMGSRFTPYDAVGDRYLRYVIRDGKLLINR